MENDDLMIELARDFEAGLMQLYGPLIFGDNLTSILGFSSRRAMLQAIKVERVPVTIFELENRKGKYAFAKDIAKWLAELRLKHCAAEYEK